ncbi:MAG: hypothetical protein S4CHLAM7_15380 [Chlamydiae bacterium]|nr:hypothetical protein [Chlamydiota bacterium]
MKIVNTLLLSLFLAWGPSPLVSEPIGENLTSSFSFPIDGGRKLQPVVNTQNGKELAIGYLTVTSIDANGALNSSLDQQTVNELVSQINQIYIQIFNKYNRGNVSPNSRSCPQNKPVPSACSQRRTPRWR